VYTSTERSYVGLPHITPARRGPDPCGEHCQRGEVEDAREIICL
jgi:hypothetical protein